MKYMLLAIAIVLLTAIPCLAQISNPSEFNRSFTHHTRTARAVAVNVRGFVIERCEHWIPEECSEYLTEQILTFLGEEKSR